MKIETLLRMKNTYSFNSKKALFQLLILPRKTFKEIVTQQNSVWFVPLIILTILVFIKFGFVAWVNQSILGDIPTPQDFQYYLPEEQERYYQAMNLARGPVFTIFFPSIREIAGIWVQWAVLSGLMAFVFKIFKSSLSGKTAHNLIAWASLPLILRYIIQVVAILYSQQVIIQTGLASLTRFEPGLLTQLLAEVDAYRIWQILLVMIGCVSGAQIRLWKTIFVVMVVFFIVLSISAMIGLGIQELGRVLTA